MTLTDISKYRFANQQLASTKFKSAGDLIAWFAAVQGQEYPQTKWGLSLRLPNAADSEFEKAFTDGKILRTHLLRPTWHLVTAEDIRWLLMLTAPRVHAVNGFMYRKLELDEKLFNRCNKILVKTLEGGKQLTRNAINEEFQKNKIIAEGHRLSYIMMYAELEGVICSGAKAGNQFTYALLEERAPRAKSKTYDEALAEITKRYFSSRGPATIKDFSTWSGLTQAECKKGIEMNKSSVNKETIQNTEYYFTDLPSLHPTPTQEIFLLPIYDELIMGYKDRAPIFEFKNSLNITSQLHFESMVACDGQIIGTWKRTLNQKSIDLKFDFFKPLNKNQTKALDYAVQRFGRFTKVPINFST